VDALGATHWSGTAWRHTAYRRPPLSGAGARGFGGRWNPPDVVATIYLAMPREACIAELERLVAGQARGTVSFPREVHEIGVEELLCVDLTQPAALDAVGLTLDDVQDTDWSACQRVGNAVQYLGIAGLLAPSATGVGLVLAVFEPHVRIGQLSVLGSEMINRHG
jgi:RES domain-containing protein